MSFTRIALLAGLGAALLAAAAQADPSQDSSTPPSFKVKFLERLMLASQANLENAMAAEVAQGNPAQARNDAAWFYKAGVCIADEATAKTFRGKYREYFDGRKQVILQVDGEARIAGFNHYMEMLNLDLDDGSSLKTRYLDKFTELEKNHCDAKAVQSFLADAEKQEASDHSDLYMTGRLAQCGADQAQYLQLMADSKQDADPALSKDYGIYMTAAEAYSSKAQAVQSYDGYHQKLSSDYQQIQALPDDSRPDKLYRFKTDLEDSLHTCVAFGLMHQEDIADHTKNLPPSPVPAPAAASPAPLPTAGSAPAAK